MAKLFSKTVYDLKHQFKEYTSPENNADIIHVLLPAWEYHVRVAESDVLDVFAEFILKILNAGITDSRKIAETLCLNLDLVKHIIDTTLHPYLDGRRVNNEGKMLLQNGFSPRGNGEIFDFIFFIDVCSGKVIAVREENGDLVSRLISEDDTVLKIGPRASQKKLSPCPIRWEEKSCLEMTTIQDFISSHDMVLSTKEKNVLKDPYAVCYSEEGTPVYLLTSLTRPRAATDQYAWVAQNVERDFADPQITETIKKLERNDSNLAVKIKSVLLADVKRILGPESTRQAEPQIKQKLPCFDLLPQDVREILMEYQISLDDAKTAEINGEPYRIKLHNAKSNLRRFVELLIEKLNEIFGSVFARSIYDTLSRWSQNGKNELSTKMYDMFEDKLLQNLNHDKIKNSIKMDIKKDFDKSKRPYRHKLQTAVLCAAITACYRNYHPIAKIAMESENFLFEFLDSIYSLNASVHNVKESVSWTDIEKLERKFFSEWLDLTTYAYSVNTKGTGE